MGEARAHDQAPEFRQPPAHALWTRASSRLQPARIREGQPPPCKGLKPSARRDTLCETRRASREHGARERKLVTSVPNRFRLFLVRRLPSTAPAWRMATVLCTYIAFASTASGGVLDVAPTAPAPSASSPSDSASLESYYTGNGLLNRGLYELAAEEYRTFLRQHDGSAKAPTARYGLGVCCFHLRQFREAANVLTTLLEQDAAPFPVEARVMLGRCLIELERFDEAVTACDEAIRLAPEHALAADAALAAIEARFRAGRHRDVEARARQFLSSGVTGEPQNRAELYAALAAIAQGNHAVALPLLVELWDRGPGEALRGQIALLRAQCHHHVNDGPQAEAWYRRALEAGEAYEAEATLGLATVLAQRGSLDEAAALLDAMLSKMPDHALAPAALMERGRILFDQGDFDGARAHFERLAERHPQKAADAEYWAAKCLRRLGRSKEAADRLAEVAVEAAGGSLAAQTQYDRAAALIESGSLPEGLAVLDSFSEEFEGHPLTPQVLYLRASALYQLGEFSRSRDQCQSFLKDHRSHELEPDVSLLIAENALANGDDTAAAHCVGAAGYLSTFRPPGPRRPGNPAVRAAAAHFETWIAAHPQDPRVPQVRLRLATAWARSGDLDRARPLLEEIVQTLGGESWARGASYTLGDVLFRRGEWEAAIDALDRFLAGNGDPSATEDALLKRGLAHLRLGASAAALPSFDMLLERFPHSVHRPQALFEKGQALVALDRDADAARAFQELLDQFPDSRFTAHAHHHLGALAMRAGDFAAAAEYFSRAGQAADDDSLRGEALYRKGLALFSDKKLAEAGGAFDELRTRFPRHSRSVDAAGQSALVAARQERCSEALERIQQLNLDADAGLDPGLREALRYEQAWCLRHEGRIDESLALFQKLAATASSAAMARSALLDVARLEFDRGGYAESARLLRDYLSTPPGSTAPEDGDPQAYYLLGLSEYELGRYAQAAEAFQRFVDRNPQGVQLAAAGYYLGDLLLKLGNAKDAEGHLARVVEQFSGHELAPFALLRLGECQAARQEWSASERTLMKFLDRYAEAPQWPSAMFGVGWARENQGRPEEAIAAYRAVTARHHGPTAARAQFQIGECLFAQQRYEDAVRELLKVDILFDAPEWRAAALFEAGRCFEKLGKLAEAREQFDTLGKQHPESSWAKLAATRLAELASRPLPGR